MKKIDIRHKKIKLRKNFFPTLIIIFFLWILIGLLIYFTDPNSPGIMPLFLLLVFLTTLFTASSIFANSRRGFLTAIGLTLFITLRYFGVGNIINLLLIFGILVASEYYFSKE